MFFNKRPLLALILSSIITMAATAGAPVFGSVVPIGGSTSDIALDEARDLLYVANFGAHVIDVIATADNTLHSSINVAPLPGAIALSMDDQYLLVAHFCNGTTSPACGNELTLIHLADGSQQIFALSNPPLGVAFLSNGQALVITTANLLLFNPAAGQNQLLETIADVALTVPAPLATFPGQILQAALSASADGNTIWGIASAGTSSQLVFQYSGPANSISAAFYTSSPLLLPQVSSAADGSFAMVGYTMMANPGYPYVKGRYPVATSSTNITGSAVDSVHGVSYGQYPDANQPAGPAASLSATAKSVLPPAMLIMDSDNLTFRDRISIPEDMVGRAVLNAAGTTLYAVSESGVMILPVGSLNSYPRIAATQEDLLVSTNFCNSGMLTQDLTITDPGGGHTAFSVSSSQAGVVIAPASGVTPATVQVLIDPRVKPFSGGTTAITLSLSSSTAVNQPRPVRLLVNNPDPSQQGTIIDLPGVLTDILPDPVRNRVYVVRQDMNQVRVLDGTSLGVIATLRTATSPTMMAMTSDQNFLLVGHDDSQLITVYDLNALQPVTPVLMPASHYARSIAVSNGAILALARNELNSSAGVIDSVSLAGSTVAAMSTLGVFTNSVSPTGVLTSSPSGADILYASPDGTVALCTATAGTFVNPRHDFTALSGAFAASDYGSYVIGNSILNTSLVSSGSISPSPLPTSGFTFVGAGELWLQRHLLPQPAAWCS